MREIRSEDALYSIRKDDTAPPPNNLSESLVFTVPGNPVTLKRPRFGKGRVYDEQKTKKASYRASLYAAFHRTSFVPSEEPMELTVVFNMPIPASWSKKKKALKLGGCHTFRPDIDNLLKFILDAYNGVLWYDDSLIWKIDAKKTYASVPSTLIEVRPWKNPLRSL